MEHRLQLSDRADWYSTVRTINGIVAQLETEWGTDWIRVDAELDQRMCFTSWQEQTRGHADITLSWEWDWDWLHVGCSAGDDLEQPVLSLLHERLRPVSREEVQRAAERGGPEHATAVHKLYEAFLTAPYDARTARILSTALESSDLLVREQAAAGMDALAWAEFAPALDAARWVETDEQLRAKLEKALCVCR
jgi:hypothetical protein